MMDSNSIEAAHEGIEDAMNFTSLPPLHEPTVR